MNLDDMLCVGTIGPFTFTQNIDRNKFKIPGELIEAIISETNQYFEQMAEMHGIYITYNGGETADVNDLVRTLTLNASMQARMRRDAFVDTNIKAGHVIVGLSSFGQASYEKEYNSGIGSNGLTLARHSVLHSDYKSWCSESYDEIIGDKAYTGTRRVDETIVPEPGTQPTTIGKLLLSPTRTYAPIIQKVLEYVPMSEISAMIHCSGGGQTKCMNFGNNVHIIKNNLFDTPPVFSLIQKESGEDWKNMYQTFNMGHRFEIYCDEDIAHKIVAISELFNVEAYIIGEVIASKGTRLTIQSPYGEFKYKK